MMMVFCCCRKNQSDLIPLLQLIKLEQPGIKRAVSILNYRGQKPNCREQGKPIPQQLLCFFLSNITFYFPHSN